MALTTFQAVARSKGGVKVEGESRGFKITIDEPEALGGTNEGMNPVELLLHSLGACQIITAKVYAPKFGVEIEDMWIELEGDIDLDGFNGVEGVKSGYKEIRFKIHVATNSPGEKVRELMNETLRICPVGDTLKSETPLIEKAVIIEHPVLA